MTVGNKNTITVSIVTVNLNNRDGLMKTLDSVFTQSNNQYEYIVIDGGSTDGSLNMLEEYSERIDYWISEPDSGIYNAMNKGIVKARGEYCLFLNSGDYFCSSQSLNQLVSNSSDIDLVYGDLLVVDGARRYRRNSPDLLTFDFFYRGESIPHGATLIKRSLFDSLGLYNEKLKISSDWAFFLKVLRDNKFTYKHISEVIVIFDGNGISARKEYLNQLKQEWSLVLSEFSFYTPDYLLLNEQKKRIKEIELSVLHRLADYINRSFFWNSAKKLKRLKKYFHDS